MKRIVRGAPKGASHVIRLAIDVVRLLLADGRDVELVHRVVSEAPSRLRHEDPRVVGDVRRQRSRVLGEVNVQRAEGAVAGLALASSVGLLLSMVTGIDPLRMAGFGLTVGLGSVVGDLVESLLKRQFGVKDSGVIMPGHGGLLDRMDALIFSAAAAYFYLQAVPW